MAYSYDRTAGFDPSILGLSPEDLKAMDPEERKEALFESLMRAADIAEHTARAFEADLSPSERAAVVSTSKEISQLARRLKR